ncbi:MAG: CHAT domain-containing protein [Bacteroidetes bacterium]|nr:CHAT domain-containing protein [Bacteroidota bacterium]
MAQDLTPVIFLAYANDRIDPDRYLRNLVSEVREIRQILENKVSPPYRIIIRANATWKDIEEVFDRHEGRVIIFHYAGHADGITLMLESDQGSSAPIGVEGFVRYLSNQKNLKLVFLNGCTTENHAGALIKAGLPAVVATLNLISDRAAAAFSKRFYQRLADRKSISVAFNDAEISTQSQLYGEDGYRNLYRADQVSAKPEFPWKLFGKGIHWRLNLQSGSTGGALIPYLCDRDRQVEVFRESLENILGDPAHPPHIFLLSGRRGERHRSLVKRLREQDIKRAVEKQFGLETGLVRSYEIRDWPYTSDLVIRQRNLKRSISQASDWPGISGGYWEARELMELHRGKGGIIIFQHTIFTEKWDKNTLELLKWYALHFWDVKKEANLPHLIIFVNLIHPEENPSFLRRLFGGSSTNQKIYQSLYSLAKENPSRLTLLRELRPIQYTDVVEWVEEYYPEDLRELPDIIYGSRKDRPLPMDVIEHQLIKESERLNRGRAMRELFDGT